MQQPLTNKGEPPNPSDEYYSLPGAVNLPSFSDINLARMIAGIRSKWSKANETAEGRLRRLSTHLVLLLLLVLVVGLQTFDWSEIGQGTLFPLKQVVTTPIEGGVTTVEPGETALTLPTTLNNFIDGVFSRAAVPRTTAFETTGAAPRELAITTYTVEQGDTVYGIAAKFGLAPETIMWSNSDLENNPDMLQVGQEIVILPVDGVYHQVGAGDTLEGIASTFKADLAAMINNPLNGFDPENPTLQPGQWVIVPGGSKPFIPRTVTAYTGPIPADAIAGTGAFGWPASGTIYQGYWSAHPGIDIAAWLGAPVLAADSGYVIAAGWDNTGYGYSVVIDHGNGYQTLYAHLQAYYVDAGINVVQGQQIGEMGSTGNSTGPHLHFEVRQGTVQRNPVGFLP